MTDIQAAERNKQTGSPVYVAQEDKGSYYPEPYHPTNPEPLYEEQLEATGATIIKSTTYFPASKITTSKRSKTHDEIADERGYLTR